MKTKTRFALPGLALLVAIGATVSGCASIAKRVGSDLVEKDLQSLEQEFKLFGTDLGQFRSCLTERGGSCQADPTAALPHSNQHVANQPVKPIPTGPSQTLAESVAKLPDGDPAKSAIALLSHPVIGQATALHNHLRGHDTGTVPGFAVTRGEGAHGGAESTATITMKVRHLHHLHRTLLASLGANAWDRLHGHCAALLAAHGDAPGRDALESDCRRLAFIRAYLGAYTRTGEFLEVDVQLAGAIHAINTVGSKIKDDIDGLLEKLDDLRDDVSRNDTKTVQGIGSDAAKVGNQTETLIENAGKKIAHRLGGGSTAIAGDLTRLADKVGSKSDALAQAAGRGLTRDVARLASDLDRLLLRLKSKLQELEDSVAAADSRLVGDINKEVGKADARLSNVFKVSNVGFVSRDSEFRAKLPTLELTLDPTVSHILTVTDKATGQILTHSSDLNDLGVATDTTGVGTGTRIGAELVRVFLEAIFDAHEGLPAVAPANASNIHPTGRTLGAEYNLPLFNSPMGNVDANDLSRMNHTNAQVAAMTRAIMGRIIAGIGPLSLNNPPLQAFMVEIITTSVREATAKATWCWYACNLDVELKKLKSDAVTTAADGAKQLGDHVESKAKQTAEHVKLRFRLD